jgi:serine/threonine protein kinase
VSGISNPVVEFKSVESYPRFQVSDLGYAIYSSDAQVDDLGVALGTDGYRAPEVEQRGLSYPTTDQFSVAQTLTGLNPFSATDAQRASLNASMADKMPYLARMGKENPDARIPPAELSAADPLEPESTVSLVFRLVSLIRYCGHCADTNVPSNFAVVLQEVERQAKSSSENHARDPLSRMSLIPGPYGTANDNLAFPPLQETYDPLQRPLVDWINLSFLAPIHLFLPIALKFPMESTPLLPHLHQRL